ncbi:MAG: cobaltochelatase subunit CobN [Euryarchaeota archaeon]|nr:cobaltochelatase subunit CobN [Euryarchaeota archaeon]MBU4608683.1 cobaltochelatase subunit CobN [Euryarchaeota archaeon]MBV1730267.1 cobaltochelatase subunit CobN [Methanobacterium sp.]MBV1755922.1 cobaltochelatase subunit CobN [Methanobacterium sp.]
MDLVTQERDTVEYEVTDLDHYYEFLGGLSRTVRSSGARRQKSWFQIPLKRKFM